jgi:hypothetical protein
MKAAVGYDRGISYDLMSGTFSGSFGGNGGIDLEWPVANVKILGEGRLGLGATLDICLNDGDPVITPGWQVFSGKVGEKPVVVAVQVISLGNISYYYRDENTCGQDILKR